MATRVLEWYLRDAQCMSFPLIHKFSLVSSLVLRSKSKWSHESHHHIDFISFKAFTSHRPRLSFLQICPDVHRISIETSHLLNNAYIYPHGLHPSHSDLACLFYAHYVSLIYCAVSKLNRLFDVRSVPGEPLREGSA
jgi:hypothetical protein